MGDANDERVGVGIVGLGFMGQTHLAAYQSAARDGHPCRLVAVCDSDPDRRAGRLGGSGNLETRGEGAAFDVVHVAAHATLEGLLADPAVTLVSVCTPTDTHADVAAAALAAGKHVLVEKPVAVQTARVVTLAGAARDAGLFCTPAMCMRFWPEWRWLLDRRRDGSLGRLRSLTLTRLGGRPGWNDFYADEERSGGAILDLHVHDADFVLALLGPPLSVSSVGSSSHVTSIYRYADVDHVVAEGGWHHDPFAFRMRFVASFDDATADFDIGRDPTLLLCRDGKSEAVEVPAGTGYDGEVRHVVDSIARGEAPSPTLEDAVLTHRLIDAERESLRTKGPVDFVA